MMLVAVPALQMYLVPQAQVRFQQSGQIVSLSWFAPKILWSSWSSCYPAASLWSSSLCWWVAPQRLPGPWQPTACPHAPQNEAENLLGTINSVRAAEGGQQVQIVVVDGGSSDGTVALAQHAGCKVHGPVHGGQALQLPRTPHTPRHSAKCSPLLCCRWS